MLGGRMSEKIAEIMHSLFCDLPHSPQLEDRCMWYEEAMRSPIPFEEQTHLEWLKLAEDQMKLCDLEESSLLSLVSTLAKIDFSKCLVRKLVQRFMDMAREDLQDG
jgi:hypothetical protein